MEKYKFTDIAGVQSGLWKTDERKEVKKKKEERQNREAEKREK